MRLVPPGTYQLEDIWMQRTLSLNDLESLDSLSATTFSQPGICLEFCHLFPQTPSYDSPQKGHTVAPISCLPLCPCLCWLKSCLN